MTISPLSGFWWLVSAGVVFGAVTLIGCILRIGHDCSEEEDGAVLCIVGEFIHRLMDENDKMRKELDERRIK